MTDDRRLDVRRVDIEKRVEILYPDGEVIYGGMSTNMSNDGLSGWFESAPKIGSDVILRVYWGAGGAPVESLASLVWTAPGGDEGEVLAGFRVRDRVRRESSGEVVYSDEIRACPPQDQCLIEKGQQALLNMGGAAIKTVVSEVGNILDDQTVEVVLKITDAAFADAS